MPDREEPPFGLHGKPWTAGRDRAGSNEDIEAVRYIRALRRFGTPEQLGKKLACIDELLEEKSRRDWLISSMKAIAGWAATVVAGWLAIRGFLTEFITGFTR